LVHQGRSPGARKGGRKNPHPGARSDEEGRRVKKGGPRIKTHHWGRDDSTNREKISWRADPRGGGTIEARLNKRQRGLLRSWKKREVYVKEAAMLEGRTRKTTTTGKKESRKRGELKSLNSPSLDRKQMEGALAGAWEDGKKQGSVDKT